MKNVVVFLFFIFLVLFSFTSLSVQAAKCLDEKPNHEPDLFQIDVTKTTAKLYFTPVNNAITNYTIVYGYQRGEQRFGVSFPFGKYDGVINYTIKELSPNMEYFFRVRADNGCRNGPLSDTMSVRTNWDSKIYTRFKGTLIITGPNPTILIKVTPQPSFQPRSQQLPSPIIISANHVDQVNQTLTNNLSRRFGPLITLLIIIFLFLIFFFVSVYNKRKK